MEASNKFDPTELEFHKSDSLNENNNNNIYFDNISYLNEYIIRTKGM